MSNSILTKEQFQEFWQNDRLEEVDESIDDSWRHGNHYWTVFEVCSDDGWEGIGEFYEATYSVTGDGEQHGIRDGDFEFSRVYPVDKVVTKTVRTWVAKKPEEDAA